jgi:catechol 2,3-dioxygenase-like lactoylglutathione lyase family enzyme
VSTLVEIALFTDDVEDATAFYQRIVGASPESEWPGGAVFSVGEAKLLVHERAPADPEYFLEKGGPPNEDHVALGVTDLDAACEALRRQGFTFLVEPGDYPWGRSAYLRDPDGRLVELGQT